KLLIVQCDQDDRDGPGFFATVGEPNAAGRQRGTAEVVDNVPRERRPRRAGVDEHWDYAFTGAIGGTSERRLDDESAHGPIVAFGTRRRQCDGCDTAKYSGPADALARDVTPHDIAAVRAGLAALVDHALLLRG